MIRLAALVATAVSALAFAPSLLSGPASGASPKSHADEKPIQRGDAGVLTAGDGGVRRQAKIGTGAGDSGASELGGDSGASVALGHDAGTNASMGDADLR